jgi:hypothetical protein
MKNSPDPEWFHKLEKRLGNYTEEPDAELWDKIASRIGKKPDPNWVPWAHRSAVLVVLLVFLWSGLEMINPAPQFIQESVTDTPSHGGDDASSEEFRPDKSAVESERKQSLADADVITDGKNNDTAILSEWKPANNTFNNTEFGTTSAHMPALPESEKTSSAAFSQAPEGTGTDKNAILKIDSLNSGIAAIDSREVQQMEPTIIPCRKRRVFLLYASVSPSSSFHKITPLMNDGIGIESINTRPVFSADRLGVSLQTGIQFKVSNRWEIFSGITLYRQSQTLVYHYLSDDNTDVKQEEYFDYTLTPGTTEKSVQYAMLNLGAEAGLMYNLSGDRLMHKIGAGFSWQHGMRRKSESDTYDNASSQYLFYQVFYRNEYAVNTSLRIFIQPFYQHGLISRESINEPFVLKPYRAGLNFGIVFYCR